jgi:hypothetical protein
MADYRTGGSNPVTLRRYSLPNVKGEGWAIFVIGSDGYFSVVSDYGDYAYLWTHAGEEFRRALIRMDWDYASRKLAHGRPKEYQQRRTLANVKDCILRYRRDGSWTAEKAREEWDLLRTYNDLAHEFDLADWIRDGTSIEDASELPVYDTPAQVVAFCKVVLPRFQALLRAELEVETPKAEAAHG